MIRRNVTDRLLAALQDTPVILLHGARQSGKTTLVRACAEAQLQAEYVTFDDATALASAAADPQGFISRFREPVIIDEVQRRLMQLELAARQLADETEEHAQQRLAEVNDEMEQLKRELANLREQWESEKLGVGDVHQVRERLPQAEHR